MLGFIITLLIVLFSLYKRYSIEYVVLYFLSTHILVGLLLQVFHFFTTSSVVFLHIILGLIFLYICQKKLHKKNKTFHYQDVAIGIVIFFLSFFMLSLVHSSYTGLVSTDSGSKYVVAEEYLYPLFSDEWVAVKIIETTIQEQRLPLGDVFFGKPKFNFLFGFHSFISELHLYFNVSPLFAYTFFASFFSAITITLSWRLLRICNVSQAVAVLHALLLLLVVNGSNLPGLWYLLPWNIGFLFLVLTYIFIFQRKYLLALIGGIVSCYMYPPIIVFVTLLFIGAFIKEKRKALHLFKYIFNRYKIHYIISVIGLGLFFVIIFNEGFRDFLGAGFDHIVRPLKSASGVPPVLHPWLVLPALTMIGFLIVVSVKKIRQKNSIFLYPILGGCFLWLLYWLTVPTILIDYHRTVTMTSLQIVLLSAFGVDAFVTYLQEKIGKENSKNINQIIAVLIIFAVFLFLSLSYTARGNWMYLKKYIRQPNGTYQIIKPRPPVNHYLHKDDVRIFSAYKNKIFLAPSWKSLVIGVATNNTPLNTKPATFTVTTLNLQYFLNATCTEKNELVVEHAIDLIYAPEFFCDKFVKIDESAEGFLLYTYEK